MSRELPIGVAAGTALTRFAGMWDATLVGASARLDAFRPTDVAMEDEPADLASGHASPTERSKATPTLREIAL